MQSSVPAHAKGIKHHEYLCGYNPFGTWIDASVAKLNVQYEGVYAMAKEMIGAAMVAEKAKELVRLQPSDNMRLSKITYLIGEIVGGNIGQWNQKGNSPRQEQKYRR